MSSNIVRSDVYLPVALAPGEPANYQVFGQLCGQFPLEDRTVHVLVHGGTYSHIYWDWPYQPERYSYVHSLTNAGYVTFNIDRIGIGQSSHPPVERVTLETHAYVLHQINQALREGKIGNVQFKRIVNVGRSFGAVTIISTVSQYGDVDGVVLTGLLNNVNTDVIRQVIDHFKHPVELDPYLSSRNLPSGYLTTTPGVRGQLFYNQDNVDPEIIALDEATKETLTPAELGIDLSVYEPEKDIHVPVLIVMGQDDMFFCTPDICNCASSMLAAEEPFFSPKAHLQTFVLPRAGHNINLHLNASEWYEAVRQWTEKFVDVRSDALTKI